MKLEFNQEHQLALTPPKAMNLDLHK